LLQPEHVLPINNVVPTAVKPEVCCPWGEEAEAEAEADCPWEGNDSVNNEIMAKGAPTKGLSESHRSKPFRDLARL